MDMHTFSPHKRWVYFHAQINTGGLILRPVNGVYGYEIQQILPDGSLADSPAADWGVVWDACIASIAEEQGCSPEQVRVTRFEPLPARH